MSDQPQALRAHAKARTAEVVAKLRSAMAQIELDIEKNDGLYPYNAGKLNRAEACRRARILTSVLGGAAHRETTLPMLRQWLADIRTRIAVGKKAVRKVVTQRANDWKERALCAEHFSNLYHLQMVTLQNKFREAQARVDELEAENLKLLEQVSQGQIVRLPTKTI
ncbi:MULTISPECIES: hypothetical protein [Rhodanobacter]|nr:MULTISPECIES: hypothetical protein [Rhodanobacter]UJM86308.1 hypothetical protein LRJ86_16235 [Rhodanobacter denitrificans]UJM90247.1 hypothetical protein LRK24_17760 [Rhodanobacter denitrificans]UJM93775.1 hypothetical protein LRK32_17705 [Rhodanobacter denitrificans]UJM97306.1 hypothetical protein LRK44_17715 [Rhodanobacter denitrificans]UJN23279.1 hypothetical protein LRK54_08920 [Rhodanobacter denitrificans]